MREPVAITPEHIRAIVQKLKKNPPRLNGLEPLNIGKDKNSTFIMVGERTNIASPFKRYIHVGNADAALTIARKQS